MHIIFEAFPAWPATEKDMAPHDEKDKAVVADVDYVILFRFADTEKSKAIAQFQKLVETLATYGLTTEVRNGEKHSVLIFVKAASEQHLYGEVYRSRFVTMPT